MTAPVKLLPVDEVRLGGPLVGLSLERVGGIRGVRPVPDNTQRMAALRPFLPVEFGNIESYRRHADIDARKYAAEQSSPSDEDIARAAAFHFHGETA